MNSEVNNETIFPNFFPEQIKIKKRENPLIGTLPPNQWTDYQYKKVTPMPLKPLYKQIKTYPPTKPPPPSPPQTSYDIPNPPTKNINKSKTNSTIGNVRENMLINSLFSNRKYMYFSR